MTGKFVHDIKHKNCSLNGFNHAERKQISIRFDFGQKNHFTLQTKCTISSLVNQSVANSYIHIYCLDPVFYSKFFNWILPIFTVIIIVDLRSLTFLYTSIWTNFDKRCFSKWFIACKSNRLNSKTTTINNQTIKYFNVTAFHQFS